MNKTKVAILGVSALYALVAVVMMAANYFQIGLPWGLEVWGGNIWFMAGLLVVSVLAYMRAGRVHEIPVDGQDRP